MPPSRSSVVLQKQNTRLCTSVLALPFEPVAKTAVEIPTVPKSEQKMPPDLSPCLHHPTPTMGQTYRSSSANCTTATSASFLVLSTPNIYAFRSVMNLEVTVLQEAGSYAWKLTPVECPQIYGLSLFQVAMGRKGRMAGRLDAVPLVEALYSLRACGGSEIWWLF